MSRALTAPDMRVPLEDKDVSDSVGDGQILEQFLIQPGVYCPMSILRIPP